MTNPEHDQLKAEAGKLFRELFPICRSLTGEGVRKTLKHLSKIADFQIKEILSGTVAYDWVVPDEWNVAGARLETEDGQKIVDFADNNLHLVGYSVPVNEVMSFDRLDKHLHTLPARPDAIPYRTSYYTRDWGFCLSHDQYSKLDRTRRYRVNIDTKLEPGSLTYAEAILPGRSEKEYIVTSYCCHPSLANDNLSGVIAWILLLRHVAALDRHYTYRFVLAPETIGFIAYLSANESQLKSIAGGYVLSCCAGPGKFSYKHSCSQLLNKKMDDVDRAALIALKEAAVDFLEFPFDINGSDERQFSAPRWRIPTGTISKDKYYEFPEYHTSDDNLGFVSVDGLLGTLRLYQAAIDNLEQNSIFNSLMPYCEPMLRKRDLFPSIGGLVNQKANLNSVQHRSFQYPGGETRKLSGNELDALLWLMFFADGKHDLMSVAEKTGLRMDMIIRAAQTLRGHGLIDLPS